MELQKTLDQGGEPIKKKYRKYELLCIEMGL